VVIGKVTKGDLLTVPSQKLMLKYQVSSFTGYATDIDA
jgi:hypothetical protein